ncbi:ArnT family glycosyltransferase [Sphingomonas sp. 28-63-12]|uniref:ArnT family glycosyltransferase n=1 Tax=Sphingomonas sp. 28-63-12 TaxID=1970434 RepID=UPI0035A864F7
MLYAIAIIEIGVYGIGLMTGRFANAEAFAAAVYQDPGIAFLPARYFFVGCGVICVLLTILVARKLFGDRIALIAGLLLAINPLHIKWSQVVRTDVQATVFMLLCVLASISVARRGRWRDYLIAGAMAGLACATKWPCAVVAMSLLAVGAGRIVRPGGDRRQEMVRLAVGMLAVPVTLVVVSPFLLLDSATVASNVGGEAQLHHLGATGGSFLWNLSWYVTDPLAHSIGVLGIVLAMAGVVLAGRRSPEALATLVPPVLIFFIAICSQRIIWARWILPLLPFLSIFIAVAVVAAGGWLRGIRAGVPQWGLQVAMVTFMAVPMVASARAEAIERQHDTRSRAADWAKAHVPPSSTVMLEHLGIDMLGQPWTFLTPAGAAGCVNAAYYLKGKISADVVGGWRGKSSVVDLGTIDPSTLAGCRADFAIFSDFDRYRAESSFYGDELAIYRRYIRGGRQVAYFAPVPGRSGGPIVRIYQFSRAGGTPAAATSGTTRYHVRSISGPAMAALRLVPSSRTGNRKAARMF